MGIVGTVDSAYKAIVAGIPGMDGAAMLAGAQVALESGTRAAIGSIGRHVDMRRLASSGRDASMQRGRRCGAMIDERHEAQACAALCASGRSGGSIEAREERLDGERCGLDDRRLAERGARPIEPGACALAVQAVAAHGLRAGLGQVREVAGEEGLGGQIQHHGLARALVAVRAVAKAHALACGAQQLRVLQRPALEVPREVRGHALAVGVAGADVHVPLLASEAIEQ
jgi:hypothetical protein